MKDMKNYIAPQIDMLCVEAEIIRTSSPITSGGEGKVVDLYDFSKIW